MNESSEVAVVKSKWKFSPAIGFYLGLFSLSVIGFPFTFGFSLWIIPALVIMSLEYLLLRVFCLVVVYFFKDKKSLNLSLVSLLSVLIVFCSIAFFTSPISFCKVGDYKCVARVAESKNSPKLCEKVASPYSPQDCYGYLAVLKNDLAYCNYAEDIDLCKISVDHGSYYK